MKLTDHIRLIWPNRPFTALGDQITFLDGLPMPTQTELDATRAKTEVLLAAEQNHLGIESVSVTMAALRVALGRDVCVQVGAWIGQIADVNDKFQAQTWWEFAPTVRRNHPVVEQFRISLNKNTSEVDSWFMAAKQIDEQ